LPCVSLPEIILCLLRLVFGQMISLLL
jgi:hypothetical protein